MNRRSFLGWGAKAVAAIGLASRLPESQETHGAARETDFRDGIAFTSNSTTDRIVDTSQVIDDLHRESADLYLELYKQHIISLDDMMTRLHRDIYVRAALAKVTP